MERSCEFCGVPRPVVYCQADAAFLCLSCDTKVHSANALSGRHYRDLLCDSCRDNTAFVRCLNHSMLLCRGCESHLHDVFSDHKTLKLKSFTGCPSPHHFASLLGFNVSEQAQFSAAGVQVGSESCMSSEHDNVKLKSSGPAKPEKGRSSKRNQEQNYHHKKQNSLVVQQILNLKKLQVTESEKQSSAPFTSSGNADSGSNQPLKEQNSFNRNLRTFDNPSHASENEDYPLPISELDHLSNSQFWSQNLQDLGVCEDSGHFDDFNIPDVDISFCNFEELFASEVDVTRPLLKDSDLMWSEVAKTALIDVSGTSRAKTTEDVSVASSISFNNDTTSEDKTQRSDNVALRTFGNMEMFFRSFLSAESSDSDCLDSGHSENFSETEAVDSSRKISQERTKSQWHGKRNKLGRNNDESNRRQRIKGGFVNVQGHESSSLNVTKS